MTSKPAFGGPSSTSCHSLGENAALEVMALSDAEADANHVRASRGTRQRTSPSPGHTRAQLADRARPLSGRPAECVEDSNRIEVVPPVHYLAVAEGEHRDVAVPVRSAGGDDFARGGVLEYHRALGRVVVSGQVIAAVEDKRVAVGPVEFGDRGAAFNPSGVAGDRDDVLEDDVFGEQVEEMGGSGQPVESLLDDAEERVKGGEIGQADDGRLHQAVPFLPILPGRDQDGRIRSDLQAPWFVCVGLQDRGMKSWLSGCS